jgi:hypothetical protein
MHFTQTSWNEMGPFMYLKQFCILVTTKINLTRLMKAIIDCGKWQLYLMASSVIFVLNITAQWNIQQLMKLQCSSNSELFSNNTYRINVNGLGSKSTRCMFLRDIYIYIYIYYCVSSQRQETCESFNDSYSRNLNKLPDGLKIWDKNYTRRTSFTSNAIWQ